MIYAMYIYPFLNTFECRIVWLVVLRKIYSNLVINYYIAINSNLKSLVILERCNNFILKCFNTNQTSKFNAQQSPCNHLFGTNYILLKQTFLHEENFVSMMYLRLECLDQVGENKKSFLSGQTIPYVYIL